MTELENFFFGNTTPYEDFGLSESVEYRKLSKQANDLEERFRESLTEKQKEELTDLMRKRQEMSTLEVNTMFLYTFKLSARMIIEIFQD